MSDTSPIDAVSLILVLDNQDDVDSRLWQVSRALGKVPCRAQILLVHPQGDQFRPGRITYRPWPSCFGTIAQAAAEAKYAQLAIVEAGAEVDTAIWQVLSSLHQESVRWAMTLSRPTRPRHRAYLGLDRWITRALLRTHKSSFAPGVCLFRYNQVRHVLDQLEGDPAEDLLRLIALARLQGQAVEELVIHRSSPTSRAPSTAQLARSLKSKFRFWFNTILFPRHHSELSGPKPGRRSRLGWTLMLMLLAGWMIGRQLDYPLLEPDESRNAQLALNLLESGDWARLTLGGQPYLDKPPLQAWLTALSYRVFGFSSGATRLPVALAAWLTVMATFFLGRRLVGFRAAWLGAMMLVLNGGFVLAGRYTTMDATLTLSVTLTLMFGWISVRSGFSRRSAAAAGLAAGLGLLAKGPVVLVLCLPPLWLARWLTPTSWRRPSDARAAYRWAWSVIPALLVAGPWYLWSALMVPDFLEQFLWRHHVVRFTQGGFNHAGPFWYYLAGMFLFLFPLSYLFPSLIRFLVSRSHAFRQRRSREMGWLLLAVVWIILFFSCATSKLPTYVLPTFPLICLLLGAWLEQVVWQSAVTPASLLASLIRRGRWELPAWCAVIGAAAVLVVGVSPWPVLAGVLVAASGGAVALWGAAHWPARRGRRATWISFAVSAGTLTWMASHLILPALATTRSDQLALEQWQARHGATATVVFVGRDPHAVDHEGGNQPSWVFEADQQEAALAELQRHSTVLLVTSAEQAHQFQEQLGSRVRLDKLPQGRHVYLLEQRPPTGTRAALAPQPRGAR